VASNPAYVRAEAGTEVLRPGMTVIRFPNSHLVYALTCAGWHHGDGSGLAGTPARQGGCQKLMPPLKSAPRSAFFGPCKLPYIRNA
jgi:hypothetical protein